MSDEWVIETGVTCVVCPDCAFTFDAYHTDTDTGSYSCPACFQHQHIIHTTTHKENTDEQ